jgi:DNA repair exonuclease SbcCD nuclease subunit
MFRFLHAADVHLDSPLRGLERYETAPVEAIRGACRRAFENLIDLAIEQRVAFLLLAGDLYDGDWKDFNTGIFVNRQVGRLGEHDISVFAVTGNHDAAHRITKSLDPPSNMTILSAHRPQTISLEELQVAIHGQGFANQHVSENLAAGFPAAEPGLFNIGLLHTSLDGREGHADYAPCTVDDLRARGYQYWALGHVHRQEVVSKDPWIVFTGCVQGRHAREVGGKGCTLVEVEDGAVSAVEQHDLDVLRWAICQVGLDDAASSAEVLDRTRKAISREQAAGAGRPVAMRVRLEGACPVADELAAYPNRIEQQVKALAAEVAGDKLWIEKVELAVTGKLDLGATLAGDTALGGLLRAVHELSDAADAVEGVDKLLAELRQKLPAEAISADTGLELDNPDVISRLVREARQLLIGRLLVEGGRR